MLRDEEADHEAAGLSIDDSWGGASTSPEVESDEDTLPGTGETDTPTPAPEAAAPQPAPKKSAPAPVAKKPEPPKKVSAPSNNDDAEEDENVSFLQIVLGGGMFFVVGSGIGLVLLLVAGGVLYAMNPSVLDPLLGTSTAPAAIPAPAETPGAAAPSEAATDDAAPAEAATDKVAPADGAGPADAAATDAAGGAGEAAAADAPPTADGPHVAFSTPLDNMKKLRARCDTGSAEDVSAVVVPGEVPGTCTVTALTNDRKRFTVVIEKAEPRAYVCFENGEKECK